MPFNRYSPTLFAGCLVFATLIALPLQPLYAQSSQPPERSQQLLDRGARLYQRGKFKAAAHAFQQSKQLNPTFRSAYFLGVSYLNSRQHLQAISAFAEAIQLNPQHSSVAVAYSHIGKAYLNLRQASPAIAAYKQAVLRQPKNIRFLENLGIAYHLNGQYKEAVQTYETALRLKPHNPDIRKVLDRARFKRKP